MARGYGEKSNALFEIENAVVRDTNSGTVHNEVKRSDFGNGKSGVARYVVKGENIEVLESSLDQDVLVELALLHADAEAAKAAGSQVALSQTRSLETQDDGLTNPNIALLCNTPPSCTETHLDAALTCGGATAACRASLLPAGRLVGWAGKLVKLGRNAGLGCSEKLYQCLNDGVKACGGSESCRTVCSAEFDVDPDGLHCMGGVTMPKTSRYYK